MAVFPVVCSSENTGMDYHAQGLSRLLHYTLCLVALPINSVWIQTHMISLATKLVSQANLSNNRNFRIASCLPDLVAKKWAWTGQRFEASSWTSPESWWRAAPWRKRAWTFRDRLTLSRNLSMQVCSGRLSWSSIPHEATVAYFHSLSPEPLFSIRSLWMA